MDHVVLNAIQLKQQSSGIGLMIYNLYKNLIEISPDLDFTILLSKDSPLLVDEIQYHVIRIPYKKQQSLQRTLYENFKISKYCKNCIYISCDSKLPLRLPKTACTFLFVTDLAVYRMGKVYRASRMLYWKYMFKHSINKSQKILAISQFTKDEIIDILHVNPFKISVVYCAPNAGVNYVTDFGRLDFVRNKYSLPEKFFLFVGNFNPRKNLINIIRAFDMFKVNDPSDYKLVIVGEKGWKFKKSEVIEAIKHKEDIIFPGYISDEDLSSLYSLSSAFVFPTLYEGFGIPLIEAQVCHTPVITSNTPCFHEVCGEGAIFVDPYSFNEICDAMHRIVDDHILREGLICKGLINSNRFSWKKSAEKLKQAILQIV